MQFALKGVTFRQQSASSIWPSMISATKEDGSTAFFDIGDYLYDTSPTPINAFNAAQAFLTELTRRSSCSA